MAASHDRPRDVAFIGHLDRGIDPHDPRLEGALGPTAVVSPDARSLRPMGASDRTDHGTAVASILAGATVDGFRLGHRNPDHRLVSARVLEDGEALARILVGLDWVVGLGARVVCLPLGIRGPTPALDTALAAVRSSGVSVVVAAGNHGAGRLTAPADSPHVLSVGSCDDDGRLHSTSGSRARVGGACLAPHVLAPGVDVRVAAPGGTAMVTGTSFAAAHVAAVVMSLRTGFPHVTPALVDHALITTARPPEASAVHRSRTGPVDPTAARAWLEEATEAVRAERDPIRDAGATATPRPAPAKRVDEYLRHLLREPSTRRRAAAIVTGHHGDGHDQHLLRAVSEAGIEDVQYLARLRSAIVRGPVASMERLMTAPEVGTISATVPDRRPRVTSSGRREW